MRVERKAAAQAMRRVLARHREINYSSRKDMHCPAMQSRLIAPARWTDRLRWRRRPGDTDLLVADGLGPDLLRDFCQAGEWLPADLRARVTQVEAKPMTRTASANHGARTVGVVTW